MEEFLDVLDQNGNKIGRKEPRTIIHKDGFWHRAVFVVIVNSKNQILLQKRGPDKESHPNCWDISVAGHIPAGKDSLTTAKNELKEELGLNAETNELSLLFSYKHGVVLNDGKFLNNSWYDIYLLKRDLAVEDINLQAEELSEVEWFEIDDLKQELKNQNQNFVSHISYPKLFKILRS